MGKKKNEYIFLFYALSIVKFAFDLKMFEVVKNQFVLNDSRKKTEPPLHQEVPSELISSITLPCSLTQCYINPITYTERAGCCTIHSFIPN